MTKIFDKNDSDVWYAMQMALKKLKPDVSDKEIDSFIDKVNFITIKHIEEYGDDNEDEDDCHREYKDEDDDSDDYHRGYEDGVEACQDAINCM